MARGYWNDKSSAVKGVDVPNVALFPSAIGRAPPYVEIYTITFGPLSSGNGRRFVWMLLQTTKIVAIVRRAGMAVFMWIGPIDIPLVEQRD